ncbi:MAG TPA: X-Pro aminopeptidase [Bacteroidales bacterium]|nr:MAG: hypothetical protein A2W98_05090 [Bacteroidetes bacterium GWF2_33_38]OFY75087.1 MAG: hypothetical protein A2265_04720 [Bacteroidetes bacterium RIFOXYA12_FULL_33_9]OFY90408.1 MAG: hypothetical protein A2236_01615 [Bacteroidetes bacterium RIFOXYA2_FULL_33_7]HBF88271.1 X-Pro aminopeptidase [Bacteroidales bacterium]
MRYKKIKPDLFIKNRKKLSDILVKSSVFVVFSSDEFIRNGDQFHKFRQNSDLFYLTGIEQEKTILCIGNQHSIEEQLFILRPNEKMEIWNGHKLTIKEAQQISGIKNVKYIDEFESYVDSIIPKLENIYLDNVIASKNNVEYSHKSLRFYKESLKKYPHLSVHGFEKTLHILRTIKEPEEIRLIEKACEITHKTFNKILKIVDPNIKEYEVEAEITYEFNKSGANHAYRPIVASGINACSLHYIENDKVCNNNDLLLLDFGAEYANYASDCSRTIPVNGKFTKRQLDCYNAVLSVFNEARKLFVPGNSIEKINETVNKLMEEEMIKLGLFTADDVKNQDKDFPLYRKYFMHGTSHFMGLDVHDVGNKTDILQKGMILTCEPGLYIKEEAIGIRIENDILVDDVPIDLMANIPIEAREIEKLMKR